MNIILLNSTHGASRTIKVPKGLAAIIVLFVFLIPVGMGVGAYHWMYSIGDPLYSKEFSGVWVEELDGQKKRVVKALLNAEDQLNAIKVRMAEMEARLVRLDALGERLTEAEKLEDGEFDFSERPAVGGPVGGPEENGLGEIVLPPRFMTDLDELITDIEEREYQLGVLASLLANRKLEKDSFVAGMPVDKGWVSSRFGRRSDPFTGRLNWHKGVDVAATDGTDILAVGAGVVTWAGHRNGYGLLVEVNHGSGYATRYAHAKSVIVRVGDLVKKGQKVAVVGMTGRSTGPHVHFEVLKSGRHIDPARYLDRPDKP